MLIFAIMFRKPSISKKLLAVALLLTGTAGSLQAQAPVRVGFRVAANTSKIQGHRLMEETSASEVDDSYWHAGFTAGAVVDIKMLKWFAIQPGFLYDYRVCDYYTSGNYSSSDNLEQTYTMKGQMVTNHFQVPVLFSFRYQPFKWLEAQGDIGPFVSWGIGGHYDKYKRDDSLNFDEKAPCYGGHRSLMFRLDWGFKMGIGLEIARHYYIGAHYLAGVRNVAKNKEMMRGAHSREWNFCLGYNF